MLDDERPLGGAVDQQRGCEHHPTLGLAHLLPRARLHGGLRRTLEVRERRGALARAGAGVEDPLLAQEDDGPLRLGRLQGRARDQVEDVIHPP